MTLDEEGEAKLLGSTYVRELHPTEQEMLATILDGGSWKGVAYSLGLDTEHIHWYQNLKLDHVQGSFTKHLFLTIGHKTTLQQLKRAFLDNQLQLAVDRVREFLPDIANRKNSRQPGENMEKVLALAPKQSRRIFFTFAIDSKQHMDTLGELSHFLSTQAQTTTRFKCSFDNHISSPDFHTDLNRRYHASDVVVIVISAQYVRELKGYKHPLYPMNVNLISQWIQADHQSKRRFVCVYFERFVRLQDSSMQNIHTLIPKWLRNQPQYLYPEQARDIFFYLSDPADNVERFLQQH